MSNGVQLVAVFTDHGVSGAAGIEKRRRLLAALTALKPRWVLLVAKRDRLARDVLLAVLVERLHGYRRRQFIKRCAARGDRYADEPRLFPGVGIGRLVRPID